ncbi:hypothetical protein XA68_13604 [Ophiocordyceps unilateralis]|uniref:Oxidoreductase-like domain-containing protein n=1 Tax=Ophiocordyceps unilateralis TaxID=268505 RepID=A0A2A9PCE4_OPHUN|nr:hypothetical protein XA68_13604 [Ophiocordyceps unilateralis]
MSVPTRTGSQALRFLLPRRAAPRLPIRRFASAAAAAAEWPQRCPLGPYYDIILDNPTQYAPEKRKQSPSAPPRGTQSESRPEKKPDPQPSAPPPPEKKQEPRPSAPPARKKKPGRKPTATSSSAPSTTPTERARIVFGSRLLGPAEEADRLAAKRARSTTMAGVVVPPRPEEPDNCCMSGCVDCVWERYREEMEEWSAKKNEAQMRLADGAGTVDADGGGSDAKLDPRLRSAKMARNLWDEEAFANVPVGIREFMKHEKRLREGRQEGAA